MLAFVFVVSWLFTDTTLVCALDFTLSKTRIILGSTGKLYMTCNVTEKDASIVYDFQIRRDTSTDWETLAFIEASKTEVPALDKHIVDDRDFVVGGILDKENPRNTHMILQMNIEKITNNDAGVYRCALTYKSNISKEIVSVERNATLLIAEAENKTDGRTDNTQLTSKCDNGNLSVIVGAILGVTNILTVLYAVYITVVTRRSRTRSFDDGSLCLRRREPEPTTVAKRNLADDQQSHSVNDDEDTYDLSK